jgi:DNA polymerase III subunit delta'
VSFLELLGQETAKKALGRAIDQHAVPQAYLFIGPESVGKTTAAIELTKTLFGNTAVNTKRIDENLHPDFVRIAPDGEFTRIHQLWNRPGKPTGALETLNFAPVAAPKRVYLFERAETFNEESANSLLKALEEPPPYVHFILCAPSQTSVLPTILSRCQLVRFTPVPTQTIHNALVAQKGKSPIEAKTLAAYAEGAPGRAFRLADTPELLEQRGVLLDLAHRIALSPGIAAFKLAEDLRSAAKPAKAKKSDEAETEEKSTRGDLGRSLDILTLWYGDLLSLALRGPDAPIVHEDRRDQTRDAASRYRSEQLISNIEALFAFRKHIARNANAQLATEVLLLKLAPKKA